MRFFLPSLLAAAFAATPLFAQTPLNLIGGAESGATITNGDLEEIIPVATSNTSTFTGSVGGNIVLPGTGGPASLEDLQMQGLSGDFLRVFTNIPTAFTATSGPTIQIPGFTLERRGLATVLGNGAFGLGLGDGTPLTAGANADNTTVYVNNGAASLISDPVDLGGNAGANTTFSLSFDIGVDGAGGDDIISFTPILRVGDVVIEGGALSVTGDDATEGVVDGSTVTFDGAELTATISQTFTLPNDIAGDTVSVEIFFSEDDSTLLQGGVDRGSVDNVELTASFIETTRLFGDFNGDGTVNTADYAVWRDALDSGSDESVLSFNGNGDGEVTVADYDLWVSTAGQTSLPAGVSLVAVPEPTSMALMALMAAAAACRRR